MYHVMKVYSRCLKQRNRICTVSYSDSNDSFSMMNASHIKYNIERAMAVHSGDEDGFTRWSGGSMPEELDINKDVFYKMGGFYIHRDRAGALRWNHIGSAGDITAYKVIE